MGKFVVLNYVEIILCLSLFLSIQVNRIESLPRSSSITCRNENNMPVDWFVIYKIPEIKDHPNTLVKTGLAYAYITSVNENGWTLSNKSINDSSSLPGLSLTPLYGISNEITKESLYVLYNDQPPVGNVSFSGGHTKGVVLGDRSGGLWMVHSVPHYPVLPQDKYSYPHTGLKNGQTFLCLTLPPDQLDRVGTQLMYNFPHIYGNSTPSQLLKTFPKLTDAAKGLDIKSPPWYHNQSLTSSQQVTFYSFAKSPEFNKDIYSDWVAPALQVNLLVETWPNGPGRLSSSCQHPYKVENVETVSVSVVLEEFSSHKDHSKWAISESKTEPWVCIGDINRATTQALRGGGTVCMKNIQLWEAFYKSVSHVESCPGS